MGKKRLRKKQNKRRPKKTKKEKELKAEQFDPSTDFWPSEIRERRHTKSMEEISKDKDITSIFDINRSDELLNVMNKPGQERQHLPTLFDAHEDAEIAAAGGPEEYYRRKGMIMVRTHSRNGKMVNAHIRVLSKGRRKRRKRK